MAYDLGKVATTNDVASGFTTSSIMGNQREMALSLQGLQNNINQGFNGLNVQLLTGINNLDSKIASCCCETQRSLDGINFNMQKNTCDIIQAFNGGIQRLVDMDTQRQLAEKDRKIEALERLLEKKDQTAEIIGAIRPVAQPAYLTCSPYETLLGNRCCANI